MFRLAVYSTLLCIAIAATAAYHWHVEIHPYDAEEYVKLVKESVELRSKKALEQQPAHQSRHRVQKDIWTLRGTERIHCRLQSARSELEITQKKGKLEAVEHLEDICCCVQDEVHANEQQVRMLKAETGTSYFPSYRFGTQNVEIACYRLPGTEMPTSVEGLQPFLAGSAQEANFMEEFSLQGNVRLVSTELQGQKSFAVSDRVVYHPQTQSVVLSCFPSNRVLFWKDGLSLSASEVEIRRDPKTGVDQVHGLGDVRCCFSAEEKDFLEQLFEKYL